MFSPTSDRSVLLVDDSNDHRLLTERALHAAHPATRCVSLASGDAAIRHLGECGQHHQRPELLARVLRAMVGGWVRTRRVRCAAAKEPGYLEKPSDQLTLDLVRLCRAQGIVPRDILQELPAGAAASSLAQQRRTVIRGLARRGWDTHELAEVFPLTPAAIRGLVRRRG